MPGNMRGGSMSGGNNGPAAPLYPNMVMNGGANPIATFYGGEVDPVNVIKSRINELLLEFKRATGQPLDSKLEEDIRKLANDTSTYIKKVQTSLNDLQNANSVLAQYPLGLGVAPPKTDNELKEMAEKGKKLNEEAAKASQRLGTLDKIHDLLAIIVAKSSPSS